MDQVFNLSRQQRIDTPPPPQPSNFNIQGSSPPPPQQQAPPPGGFASGGLGPNFINDLFGGLGSSLGGAFGNFFPQLGTSLNETFDDFSQSLTNYYNQYYNQMIQPEVGSALSDRGLGDSELGANLASQAASQFFAPALSTLGSGAMTMFGNTLSSGLGALAPFLQEMANEKWFDYYYNPHRQNMLLGVMMDQGRHQNVLDLEAGRTGNTLYEELLSWLNGGGTGMGMGQPIRGMGGMMGAGGGFDESGLEWNPQPDGSYPQGYQPGGMPPGYGDYYDPALESMDDFYNWLGTQ